MSKLNLVIAFPNGLDDALRAASGAQPTGTVTDTNGVTLTAVVVQRGSFMDQGISISEDGKSAFGPAFIEQFSQLVAAKKDFDSGMDASSIEANLEFANGDIANFKFVGPPTQDGE